MGGCETRKHEMMVRQGDITKPLLAVGEAWHCISCHEGEATRKGHPGNG